ncbi:Ig-like domain-containing protein [Actinoplanes regularis]|uniref:Glyoxal oxidase N-terminus n=1 Tax=Actinoplanes regularis TaxID=52697 RepID=A0A239AW38_9ACTN|nr:Ig-like domain-containing protein [Actinoplanes regularis]SNR99925.1 Glyoxal oxidase N-terminus [Actinoplanes regularis]
MVRVGMSRRRRRLVAGATIAAVVAGGMAVSVGTALSAEQDAAPEHNHAGQHALAAGAGQVTVGSSRIALNQPAEPYLGKFVPPANAHVTGVYSALAAWPLVGIHMALLPNGHVVSYGTPPGEAKQGGFSYDDWDPAAGVGTGAHRQAASMHQYDAFCNSLERLPDGRLLMVGGNSTTATMVYDPANGQQTMGAQLNRQRWYTSVLRLPDDRMLVLGGGDSYNVDAFQKPDDNTTVATTPEIGTGTGAWTRLTGADSTVAFGARDNRWWYPRAYVAPDGKVFGVSYDQLWKLDPAGTGKVTALGKLPVPIGVSGSSVMYAPGKLLFAGGGQYNNGSNQVATDQATLVDINGANPVVAATNPMRLARNWLNLTVLPNGEVLANGGTRVGTQSGAANSAYDSEIWNPATRKWRDAAKAQRIRSYHSTAVLLPGGSVLTAAGGVPGPEDNFNAEIFYPPYLFTKGTDGRVRWANRSQITAISGALTYGGTVSLELSDSRKLASVSLIRATSVTHSYNTDQRRIPLAFSQNGKTMSVSMPSSANQLPPGSYLLSGVDTNGVPTPAQMVTIKRSGAGTVTVYAKDQTAADFAGPSTKVRFPVTDGYLRAGEKIRVEASDPSGVTDVQLLINGTLTDSVKGLASDGSASLRWSATAPEGTATMTVRVYDSLNNVTETTRKVLVDNQAPALTTSPAAGAYARGTTLTAGVTKVVDASGLAQLRVQIDNGRAVAVTAAPWTAQLAIGNLADGRHTITFQGQDKAGNPAVVRKTVNIDNHKPTLRITSAPKNNSTLRAKVTISASAADNLGVDRVELLIDGKVVMTDRTAAYQLALDPKKYGKTFTMQLRAYDRARNVVYSEKRTYRR